LLKRQLSSHDFQVTTADTYADAEVLINKHRYQCIVLGYMPSYTDEIFPLLNLTGSSGNQSPPILIVSHETDRVVFEWVAKNKHSALLTWDDYSKSSDCLTRLINQNEASQNIVKHSGARLGTRILFVDDTRTAQMKFTKLLEKNGYYVEVAGNCLEAMTKAKQGNFDIAVIDYFMPNGNGDELCRMLRDDPDTRSITSAVITGTYMEDVIKDTLAAGAIDCMFKDEANELFLARVAAMSRSIHTRKSIESERHRLSGILSSVGDGVYGVDSEGNITFMNPTAKSILGLTDDSRIIGKRAYDLFHYADENGVSVPEKSCLLHKAYESGENILNWQTSFWHSKEKPIPVECTVLPLNIRNVPEGAVVAFRDITERKSLENELMWQANHDALTKLYNRRYFEQRINTEVSRIKRSNKTSALLYLDLDRFKYINDTAGHAAGDQLLIEISSHLKSRLRDADLLARLGGDEFAVILTDIDIKEISTVADSFREVLEQFNFNFEGKQYRVYCSIGVSVIDKDSTSASDTLANADIACHVAKGRGRNQVHVYNHDSDEKIIMSMQLGWSDRLHKALENDGFMLVYQPILQIGNIDTTFLPHENGQLWHDLQNASQIDVEHYEVLIRYREKSGELIPPNTFLPTAERFGIMPQIDSWVLKRAIEKLARLNRNGHRATFSINISGETMEPERLITTVKNLLSKYNVDPRALIFEITESSAIQNIESAKQLMNDLKTIGCQFALDDFGSGFSSFNYLKHLPVDLVKIDGQFVQNMMKDSSDRAIVSSINDIAHSFGKKTIAEFVESPEIFSLLKEYGIDYVQGYYVSAPIDELPEKPSIAVSGL
jgi:diguanylate cyclase (GGDEF)-like protein/PAS domain S-box-containing protein